MDFKIANFSSIAPRLGLSERLQIPEPMPFSNPDPLGASTLESDATESLDLGKFFIKFLEQ